MRHASSPVAQALSALALWPRRHPASRSGRSAARRYAESLPPVMCCLLLGLGRDRPANRRGDVAPRAKRRPSGSESVERSKKLNSRVPSRTRDRTEKAVRMANMSTVSPCGERWATSGVVSSARPCQRPSCGRGDLPGAGLLQAGVLCLEERPGQPAGLGRRASRQRRYGHSPRRPGVQLQVHRR
jgi:hypothetical protein